MNLRERLGSSMRESMGADRPPVLPPATSPAANAREEGVSRPRNALEIPLGKILPDPEQPRKTFPMGEILDLAMSLTSRGQLQPIRVRWCEELAHYVVISGERRLQAAKKAELKTLLCIEERESKTTSDILEDQLVENLVREDLKPVEQAAAFRKLMREKEYTQNDLARLLNISQASVSRALSLLELPTPIQEKVDKGEIAPHTARVVAGKISVGTASSTKTITLHVPSATITIRLKEGGDMVNSLREALQQSESGAA